MSEILRVILVMSVSGSILALLLLALKPMVKNRLPKSAQYYLWLVVIAALLVPVSRLVVLPEGKTAIPSISSTIDRYVVNAEEVMERVRPFEVETADGFISVPESSMKEVDALIPKPWVTELVDWCAGLYSLGVMFVLAFYICAYGAFVIKLKQTNIITDIDCPLPVYRNIKAATPMLIGLFHPVVVLPDCDYTDAQLHAVLLHELTHLWRKDVFVKWLSLLACVVHWFNPIVWLSRREIDRACEFACDEAVIRSLDAEGKRNYGNTLIHVAAKTKTPHAVLSTTMCEEKKTLKERLEAIMKNKKPTRIALIASAVLIIAVGGVAVALGAGQANNTRSGYSFDTFVVNGYKLFGYMDAETISKLTPVAPLNSKDGYAYNFSEIRFDLDSDECITRFQLNVSDIGIFNMWMQYAQPREDGNGLAFIAGAHNNGILWTIDDVEALIGEGQKGWFDREQRFMYERYTADTGYGEVKFIYYSGKNDEMFNSLIWVIVESGLSGARKTVGGYDLDRLSKMRIPYVGDNSSVADIVHLLPISDSRLVQKFISISDDYGSGYAPYTLTLYYEPRERGAIMKSTDFPPNGCDKNAILLFALIDNLQEVSFAFRTTTTEGGELDKSAYEVQVNYTKAKFTDEGIEWSGLWNGDALNKEYFQETKPNNTPSQPEKAPQLEASFITDGSQEQRIRALQLTTSWSYVDEKGNGSGYEADSPHALQLKPDDLEKAALRVYSVNSEAEITFKFSDNYPPQSVSVQRWPAEYATGRQNIEDVIDKSETISVNGSRIRVGVDGQSYIYEVYAKWEQGSSRYAFQTELIPASPQSYMPDFKPENPTGVYSGIVDGKAYGNIFNEAILQKYSSDVRNEFMVYAPTIHSVVDESGKLKAFVTVHYEWYRFEGIDGKTVVSVGGGVIPGAITFIGESSGGWSYESYDAIGEYGYPDGGYFSDSIRKLCVMPVSGAEIKGLAKKVIDDYSDHTTRNELLRRSLVEHLLQYGMTGVSLKMPGGSLVKLT